MVNILMTSSFFVVSIFCFGICSAWSALSARTKQSLGWHNIYSLSVNMYMPIAIEFDIECTTPWTGSSHLDLFPCLLRHVCPGKYGRGNFYIWHFFLTSNDGVKPVVSSQWNVMYIPVFPACTELLQNFVLILSKNWLCWKRICTSGLRVYGQDHDWGAFVVLTLFCCNDMKYLSNV